MLEFEAPWPCNLAMLPCTLQSSPQAMAQLESTCIGFMTSLMKVGWMYASRICLCSRFRTVLVNLGEIFCGLKLTLNSGSSTCQQNAVTQTSNTHDDTCGNFEVHMT